MQENHSVSWFNDQLESLYIYNDTLFEKALALKNSLVDVLSNKLQCELWELSEFLVLVLAFNLMDELCSNNKTIGSMYKHEWKIGIGIIRPLMIGDIKEIRDKFLQCYQEKFELLKKSCLSKEINCFSSPIVFLELAESIKSDLYLQRYITTYEMTRGTPSVGIEVKKNGGMSELIRPELARLIRYKTFSLSQQQEDACNEFPYVYTLVELANRWKTNEKNVILACGKSSYFWPYLNISEGMKLIERTLPITTAMINENLRNGNLQADYKYGLKGYVRLAKKIDLPHKITLEYFYANKFIDPKINRDEKSYTPFIWLEAPFCKYILGIYQFLEVTRPIEPTLFFLADEVHYFEKTEQFKKLVFVDKNSSFPCVIDDSLLGEEKKIDPIELKLSFFDDNQIADTNEIKHEEKSEIPQFYKNGNCYEIDYMGQKFMLKISKGLEYIEYLLRNTLKEIHVCELERTINKYVLPDQEISLNEAEEADLNDINNTVPDDVADEKAIKMVSAALKVKEEELKIAKEGSQLELAEKIEEEIEQLKKYLNGALGKNYKPRKIPDENEKARKRVLYAIKNARNTIKSYNHSLFEHLHQTIKTGYFCVYKPASII